MSTDLRQTAIPFFLTILSLPGISQDLPEPIRTARITVTAVNALGSAVSGIKVDSFVDEKGREQVALFHGPRASNMPFGLYRITVESEITPPGYYPATFDVDVNARDVLITAALEWGGLEGRVTGPLRGRLAGFPPEWSHWWCKASGLYLRQEYESSVTAADLHFDFGEVPPGIYLLACVAEKKYIVVRTISINGGSKPFTVDYKPGDGGEAVKH